MHNCITVSHCSSPSTARLSSLYAPKLLLALSVSWPQFTFCNSSFFHILFIFVTFANQTSYWAFCVHINFVARLVAKKPLSQAFSTIHIFAFVGLNEGACSAAQKFRRFSSFTFFPSTAPLSGNFTVASIVFHAFGFIMVMSFS